MDFASRTENRVVFRVARVVKKLGFVLNLAVWPRFMSLETVYSNQKNACNKNLDSYLLMSRVGCNPLIESFGKSALKKENLDGGCLLATLYLVEVWGWLF